MNEITNDKEKLAIALSALHGVDDPEIGLNVVDLGLIYQIDFDEENKKIFCRHSLTTQFCPMGESINEGVKSPIAEAFPDYGVETDITFDPPWSSSRISGVGRAFLNM